MMNHFVRKGFGVLGAALLVLGSLPAPALAQTEVPDLELAVLGLSAKDRTLVHFEVRNIGPQWTKPTTASIGLTTGAKFAPKTHVQTFDIPDLNPKGLVVD